MNNFLAPTRRVVTGFRRAAPIQKLGAARRNCIPTRRMGTRELEMKKINYFAITNLYFGICFRLHT